MKRLKLSDKDFDTLEKYAAIVFRHSDDWFYDEYFFRKTIEIEDLDDLLTAFVCDDNIDLKVIAESIENKRLAEIILLKATGGEIGLQGD